MPFNDLMINGLQYRTSYSGKNKKEISLSRKSGEVILFFEIDNITCETRNRIIEFKQSKLSHITGEGAVCDLLIVYSKQGLDCKLFILVELKGDTEEQIRKAVRQILTTHKYLECELRRKLNKVSYSKIEWIGIVLSRCSHNQFNRFLKEESSKFGYSAPPIPILPISKPVADDKLVRKTVNEYYKNLM